MGRRRGNRTAGVAIVRARLDDLEPIDGRKPYAVVAVESRQSLSHLAATILLSFGFEMDHCYGFYSDIRHYRGQLRNTSYLQTSERRRVPVLNMSP